MFNPWVSQPEFPAAVVERQDDRTRIGAGFVIERIDDDDEREQFALQQLLQRGHLKAMRVA